MWGDDMELQISRLMTDERVYLIDAGENGRSVLDATTLKQWLLDIGFGDSTIAAVLDMSPMETMFFEVANKAA